MIKTKKKSYPTKILFLTNKTNHICQFLLLFNPYKTCLTLKIRINFKNLYKTLCVCEKQICNIGFFHLEFVIKY